MPTVASCESCGKKLRIPDGMTAAKARCPGCGAIIALVKTGITAKTPVSLPKKADKPRPKPPPEEIDRDEPDDDEVPRPRKKKRKRRRKAKSTSDVPLWIWGALAGVLLLFAGIVTAVFIHSGHGAFLLGFIIGMAIMLPVSVVILVISMFIASALLGGIDFGQAHVAIPKAGALLFVVNLLQLIPFVGWILALPVWFLGLMKLFDLDFAETRILVFINWGLNSLFRYFMLAILLSAMMHASMKDDDPLHEPLPSSDEDEAVERLEAGMVLARSAALLHTQEIHHPYKQEERRHVFHAARHAASSRRLKELDAARRGPATHRLAALVSANGPGGTGRPVAARVASRAGHGGEPGTTGSQDGGHSFLVVGWSQPHRHVGPQAGRPARSSWPLQAHRHEGARHPGLRSSAASGADHG